MAPVGMQQAWMLPAIPAAVFVIVALFNGLLPRRGDWLVILGGAAVVAIVFMIMGDFQQSFHDGIFAPAGRNVFSFSWVNIDHGFFVIPFSTYVDAITMVMLPVVSIVALMVMIYSTGYMHGEARYGWYFAALSLFIAAMLMLVVAGNLIQLYLAWEGVGLASYLLIGFYWERQSAAEAAKILADAGADIVGANCWMDPAHMLPIVEQMRKAVKVYIAAQPAAYRCTDEVPFFVGQKGFPDRLDSYKLTRYELGDFAKRARDIGVNYIGGCCGCEGSHIRQMARALGKKPTELREWNVDYEHPQSATEAYKKLREKA